MQILRSKSCKPGAHRLGTYSPADMSCRKDDVGPDQGPGTRGQGPGVTLGTGNVRTTSDRTRARDRTRHRKDRTLHVPRSSVSARCGTHGQPPRPTPSFSVKPPSCARHGGTGRVPDGGPLGVRQCRVEATDAVPDAVGVVESVEARDPGEDVAEGRVAADTAHEVGLVAVALGPVGPAPVTTEGPTPSVPTSTSTPHRPRRPRPGPPTRAESQ